MRGLGNRGKKRSESFKKRVSEGLRVRKEKGQSVGRPRENPIYRFICSVCGKPEIDAFGHYDRKACGRACSIKIMTEAHRKIQEGDVPKIVELYKSGLTQEQIGRVYKVGHRTIGETLKRAGCPIRHRKTKGYCQVAGCDFPVHLIWHSTHEVWYGTKCQEHLKAHRKELTKRRWQKIKQQRQLAHTE